MQGTLETKASSRAGQCILAGCRVTLPRRVLITMSVMTMHSIFRKLCVQLFTFCKISTAIFASCGAIYRRLCEMFSVTKCIWSRNRCRKQRSNQCIIGNAIPPQTGTKLTKKRGSKFGAVLRCHLMPQRKPQYR